MNLIHPWSRPALALLLALALGVWGSAHAADQKLAGDNEVPPVKTMATGLGNISVAADGTVTGKVSTKGVNGTMAHIHTGAPGQNGPPIITLVKGSDGEWMVPPGARLSTEQMKSYKAGNLYINVHSDTNKDGEIRAQLKP